MLTEDQIEAMARANWPGIEWDDESLAESAHLREAFRAGVRAVIAAHEAKAAPAVPRGWYIAITGSDEVVVRAPSDGPGAMTIPSGSDGALPVRLLSALCRALLASPSQPAVPQGEPVAWRVSSKDEPELGFWLDEEGPGDDDMGLHYEPLYTAPSQPVTQEPEKWCEYVAGMIFGWLQMQKHLPDEVRCIDAIAGIIRRRLWAYKPSQPVTLTDEPPRKFVEWIEREMPKNTVIGDPTWWAPRIYRAVISALREKEQTK